MDEVSEALGRRIKILVGKPGLDGHSNGAEQIAVRARDAGMDVVYEGIRLTPAPHRPHRGGRGRARGGPVDPVRLPRGADPDRARGAARGGRATCRSSSAGSSRPADEVALLDAGVARVYTPKDFEVTRIMGDIVSLVAERNGVVAARA